MVDLDNNKQDNNIQWNSSLGFLLAMIGSAVGLGNIWRYPYVVYSNGGGSFLVVYLISIFLVGIPFLLLEYSIGFKFKTSLSETFKLLKSKFEIVGWFIPIVSFSILTYYSCIIGWDLIYFVLSFFKGWGTNTDNFFAQTLLQSTNSLAGLSHIVLVCLLASIGVWFVTWFISHKGINKGIGKANMVMIPLLFIIMIAIVIYSLTLNGAYLGLQTLFTPDWGEVFNPHMWVAAISQILFSLSIGSAIIPAYTSYLPKDSKLTNSAFKVVCANCGFELFTAVGIFSILGFMATTSGSDIHNIITHGTGLLFVVLPEILNVMGPVAYIIGPIFFLAVFFAGITSSVSLIEPLVLGLERKFNLRRKKATTYLCIIGLVVTIIFTTDTGSYLLATVDSFLTSAGILFAIILEAVIFSWFAGLDKLLDILNNNSTIKIGGWWKIVVKYIAPIILIYIWIGGIIDTFSANTQGEIFINIILTMILITIPLILTKLPLKKHRG
jgi:NSS family neurotransmitter:Na+ symporter